MEKLDELLGSLPKYNASQSFQEDLLNAAFANEGVPEPQGNSARGIFFASALLAASLAFGIVIGGAEWAGLETALQGIGIESGAITLENSADLYSETFSSINSEA